MQAQATRTETQSITVTQSLAAVQTMLRAALGCITYLRDLLPEENFTQSHLVADEDTSTSYQGSGASFSSTSNNQSKGSNGFKITTMTRGYSDEGDKILNYLENGIFDALQKEYLRSFIFAIYLDNKDPSNIVEAYTFNFQYHTLAGTNLTVPIMTLGENLQGLSFKGRTCRADNVTEAIKKGKAPTLLDVKKSVKALLKTLIQATTQMDILPKRRFATFKLFYTDKTPADYEPLHFQAGDEEKDKWFFMTHDLDEIPDKWSIGKVNTGHHSMNLSVTSIATYLPSSTQHNNATFSGTVARLPTVPHLTPVQEATLRAAQAERQIKDAQERVIAWSGENSVELADIDGEGDDDPDYIRMPDGSYREISRIPAELSGPAGVRNNDTGHIEPFSGSIDVEEALFTGIAERVPTKLQELAQGEVIETSNLEQTQTIEEFTQNLELAPMPPGSSFSPSNSTDPTFDSGHCDSSWAPPTLSPITSLASRQSSDVDMDIVKEIKSSYIEETEALDMETQMESIEPYSQGDKEAGQVTLKQGGSIHRANIIDNGLDCECGVSIEDECCFCEGGCSTWYHVWCMGYHSVKDPRLPSKFYCFSCRLHADPSWPLIKADLYPVMLPRFQDLSLFRRAIKTTEVHQPETISEFSKASGVTWDVGRQLIRRLEKEGFVTQHLIVIDDLGFPQTVAVSTKSHRKGKSKQPKNRKNVQKTKYLFNREMLKSAQYADYFNSDPKVEARILNISELTSSVKRYHHDPNETIAAALNLTYMSLSEAPQNETQTQVETQAVASRDSGLKRGKELGDNETTPKPKKKMKISITHGLDLAE